MVWVRVLVFHPVQMSIGLLIALRLLATSHEHLVIQMRRKQVQRTPSFSFLFLSDELALHLVR